MINIKDLYWLSGILEGEGTFYLMKSGNRYYPTLQVGSSDYDVVARIARIMRCHNRISEHKSKYKDGYIRKRHYRVSLSSNHAV